MIELLNYGSGNINAFVTLFKKCRIDFKIIETAHEVNQASRIIFPGVGAFDPTINNLKAKGLFEALQVFSTIRQRPLLGVCVGMQCLFGGSAEGLCSGLGVIPGRVDAFNQALFSQSRPLPHMGWNSISENFKDDILKGLSFNTGFYFLHGFHGVCEDKKDELAECEYGYVFPAIVKRGLTYGVQFHPEKSHQNGEILIANFSAL
jgi:glutamine amidotransferase